MFYCYLYINLPCQDLINRTGHVLSDWVYLGGVKAFADGSLGANSALFHEVRFKSLFFFQFFWVDRILVIFFIHLLKFRTSSPAAYHFGTIYSSE